MHRKKEFIPDLHEEFRIDEFTNIGLGSFSEDEPLGTAKIRGDRQIERASGL